VLGCTPLQGSGFRSAILLILKTPYCIGTLLALLLNLILPTEKDDEEDIKGIELKHKTDGVSSTAAPVDISSS
jgi:xanthine/uracil permease